MESAASIRVSNPMVAAGDSTDVLNEYGIRVADPALVAKARAIVDHFVAAADARFTAHVETRKRVPQSPYDDVVINGRALRQVAIIGMGSPADFEAELVAHFGPEHGDYVDGAQLTHKIGQVFGKLLEDHGFEVVSRKALPSADGLMQVIVRDPVHIAAIDAAEVQAAKDSRVAVNGDVGVTTPCSPRQLDALRKVIDGLCNDAVREVTNYLAVTGANGGSPFSTGTYRSYHHSHLFVADPRRVSRKDYESIVVRAVNVPLFETEVLRERAKQAVGEHVEINIRQVEMSFMNNFASLASARPELMLAGICERGQVLVAVCSPEPPPAPPRFGWLGRIAQYFARKGRELRAALPAPKESAKALPPPAEPVVVPPIAVPSTFFETEREG